jgi:hypothetical protein
MLCGILPLNRFYMELALSTLRKSEGSESQLPDYYRSGMTANVIAPRNGGRIESIFQLHAAQPLSWGVCSQAFNFITA